MKIKAALQGGGGKGIAFIGMLHALDDLDIKFEEVSGTSAGAITATFIAAGFTPEEIEDIILKNKVNFKDIGWWPLMFALWTAASTGFYYYHYDDLSMMHIIYVLMTVPLMFLFFLLKRVHLDGGVFLGNTFLKWFRGHLSRKLNIHDRDITFEDFPIPLSIVAAAPMEPQKLIVFNKKNTPNFPVCRAVRASISLPLIFTAPREGFPYPGTNYYVKTLVDGGTILNTPYEVLSTPRKNAFAFVLDETPGPRSWLSYLCPTLHLLYSLTECMRTYYDDKSLKQHESHVIKLPVFDYPTTKFTPSDDEYHKLTTAAYSTVKDSQCFKYC